MRFTRGETQKHSATQILYRALVYVAVTSNMQDQSIIAKEPVSVLQPPASLCFCGFHAFVS